ncbi:hypothetical protein C8R45DRAFT_991990 [Mycena sanguinolenta]|nr:hypothetical protein C8R45DRAFT_991990 [Mycena sanguinolenta]
MTVDVLRIYAAFQRMCDAHGEWNLQRRLVFARAVDVNKRCKNFLSGISRRAPHRFGGAPASLWRFPRPIPPSRTSRVSTINRVLAVRNVYNHGRLNIARSSFIPATGMEKRHVCPHCGQTCSTSSHLARHSRIHKGLKEFKCDYPGCEKRSSRLDNLRAHQRIHSGQPRPKKLKASAHTSPVSSAPSSPDISYQPSPTGVFHGSAHLQTSNGVELFMPYPQSQAPFTTLDQFNNPPLSPSLSAHSRGAPSYTYSRLSQSMPPPIVCGVQPDNAFNNQFNMIPRRGSGDFYRPGFSSPYAVPHPYPVYAPGPETLAVSPEFHLPQEIWYNWNFSPQNNM